MDKTILRTDNLTVRFGRHTVLDSINIELMEKHIYGCIGENGAGKTTLMRVLTGLLYPTDGGFSLFGKSDPTEIMKMRKYIGSTIESPALYPEYSAWRNLELQRILLGNPDKNVCDDLLRLVNLYDERNKTVRKFSMGMKQRLGIAMSLIGKPKLLILDEPINGLDPKNISELRILLKKLNEEKNVTLFISSHILNELYLLASDYFIIHKGKIIEALTHKQLNAKCRKYIKIVTSELPRCITVIEKNLKEADYTVIDNETLHLFSYTDKSEIVSEVLVADRIITKEFSVSEQSLEEYFLNVTGGDGNA